MRNIHVTTLITAITMLLGSTIASAGGVYGTLRGSSVFLEDSVSSFSETEIFSGGFTQITNADAAVEFDAGWGVGGAVGYAFDLGHSFCDTARVEGEIAYRSNDLDSFTVTGTSIITGPGLPAAGISSSGTAIVLVPDEEITSLAGMANVSCDVPVGPAGTKFFLLGGLGVATFEIDDGDDTVFAYQFGVGLAHPITDMLDLTLEYRYFATTNPEFSDVGGSFEAEYDTHNVTFGVRYNF